MMDRQMRAVSESPMQRPHPIVCARRCRPSLLPRPCCLCPRPLVVAAVLRMPLCLSRRLTDCLPRDGSPLVFAVESLQLRSATAAATDATTAAVAAAAAA